MHLSYHIRTLRVFLLILLVGAAVSNCGRGYVSLDNIAPNPNSNIVVFTDTFQFGDIIQLSSTPSNSTSDSILLFESFLDTTFSSRAFSGLLDSSYSDSGFQLINKQPLIFDVEGIADSSKSISQLAFISLYNPSDFTFFSGNNGDSVYFYSGFSNKTPSNNLFPSIPFYKIDSASLCEAFRLEAAVENNLNFDIEGVYSIISNGQAILTSNVYIASGDKFEIDSVFQNTTLGKNIKIRFEDVSTPGINVPDTLTPVYIDNSLKLKFKLVVDNIKVSSGKVKPNDQRYFLGSREISYPLKDFGDPFNLFVCSGSLNAQYNLNGFDGPFYVIREVTDSSGYSFTDSSLMVQSPTPFVNDIVFNDDSLYNLKNVLFANYYIRPLSGFPVRIKPNYSVESKYATTGAWNICYFRGPIRRKLLLSNSIYPGLRPERSHLWDSLSLANANIDVLFTGAGIGTLRIYDSAQVKYNMGNMSYMDSVDWAMGVGLGQIYDNNQLAFTRLIDRSEDNSIGMFPNEIQSDIRIGAQTRVGLVFGEDFNVQQGMSTLLGFCEGFLQYNASTELRINSDGAMDSLVFDADSLAMTIIGYGNLLAKSPSDLRITLSDTSGKPLLDQELSAPMDSTLWETRPFEIKPQHVTGTPMQLVIKGDLKNLEGHYLSANDFMVITIKLDFINKGE